MRPAESGRLFTPQIRRILFPVDFSGSCFGAARYVEAIAGHFEAEVMLLHAVAMSERNWPQDLAAGREAELEKFLSNQFKHFTTKRECVLGEPAVVIAEHAQSWNPDLVMMATHGVGYFRRHLLGSVTSKMMHDLACPMWTSAHAESAPALEDIHYRRILCAVDLGDRSRCILRWAAWFANEFQADLGVVHVLGDAEDEVAAADRLDSVQLQAGTRAPYFLKSGNPADAIAKAGLEVEADLIVIGRHNTAGVNGRVLHDAYAVLRESECPVITL